MNKNITKKIAAAAFILGATVLGTGVASADTGSKNVNHNDSLITALAQRFNLSTTDVKAVFDQVRTQNKATMSAARTQNEATRLAKAVTDGKLTQAQADLIKAKQAEVKTFMDSLVGKTQTEKMAAMKTEMASLKKWATDNNIPQGFLQGAAGMNRGHMGGKMMK